MAALVQRMLDLHRQLAAATGEHERTMLARQIEATDRQIDALFYELYGLSEEEIGIEKVASKQKPSAKVFKALSPCLSQAI